MGQVLGLGGAWARIRVDLGALRPAAAAFQGLGYVSEPTCVPPGPLVLGSLLGSQTLPVAIIPPPA